MVAGLAVMAPSARLPWEEATVSSRSAGLRGGDLRRVRPARTRGGRGGATSRRSERRGLRWSTELLGRHRSGGSLARGRMLCPGGARRLGEIVAADLVYVAPRSPRRRVSSPRKASRSSARLSNRPAVSQHMASGELDAGMAATFVLITARRKGWTSVGDVADEGERTARGRSDHDLQGIQGKRIARRGSAPCTTST